MARATSFIILASVLVTGGCAGGPSSTLPEGVDASMAAANAVGHSKDSDVVCFHHRDVGSRIAHVVCLTRAERQANRKKSREALEKLQNSGQNDQH